jgi:hypothetical protein
MKLAKPKFYIRNKPTSHLDIRKCGICGDVAVVMDHKYEGKWLKACLDCCEKYSTEKTAYFRSLIPKI